MSILSVDAYRSILDQETRTLASTDDDHLRLEIPHIQGWTVQSVIGHTGWVLRYVDAALQADPDNPPSRSAVPEPPPSDEVVAWMAQGARTVKDRLATIDLDSIHPTFTGPQPASWWLRRLAQEVSMHRWDTESAWSSPDPIDAHLARDGVDEVLEVFAPTRMDFDSLGGSGETVHLHATDIDDGEWMITYEPDKISWTKAHGKGDVAARGSAQDLLLLLWSRIPPSRLELHGDANLLDRWQQAAAF